MLLGGLFPHPPQPHHVLIVHNPTYMRKLGRIISLFGRRYVSGIVMDQVYPNPNLKPEILKVSEPDKEKNQKPKTENIENCLI